MTSLRIALLAAALAASGSALAQQPPFSPFYFGVGAGWANLSRSGQDLTGLNNASLDTNETAYTIRAGWRFNPYMALEANYYDLGKYKFHGRPFGTTLDIDGEAKAKTAGVSFVGILPMNQFDLYGKIGWTRSELKLNASAPLAPTPVNVKDKENGAMYGVGGRWTFLPNWALFAEWAKADKIRVDSYLIGVDWKF